MLDKTTEYRRQSYCHIRHKWGEKCFCLNDNLQILQITHICGKTKR